MKPPALLGNMPLPPAFGAPYACQANPNGSPDPGLLPEIITALVPFVGLSQSGQARLATIAVTLAHTSAGTPPLTREIQGMAYWGTR